ncbi:phage baseplate assembly protein V [Mycobacterium sp. 48b]|uniref:phage baseplate assembly protein V n=1 Tax=Mycobacterium sp. 48b TaxID=3400426 RepID=UPI003AAFE1F3
MSASLTAIIDGMSDQHVFGVYRGLVAENVDPQLAGRVKVAMPLEAGGDTLWAPVAHPVASVAQEAPAVGAEVLVAFEAGDPSRPYVIGALRQNPPIPAVRLLTLGTGHQVVIDEPAQEVRVLHPNGTELVLESDGGLTITAPVVNVDAPTARFSGTVTCTTMVASTGVISPSYTPGAGNIM